jgi:hypothetical protein
MRDGSIFFAIGALIDSTQAFFKRNWRDLKLWFSKASAVKSLWKFVYGKWMDEGDTIIRVLGWRSALLKSRWGNVRGMTACFWWFD